MTEYSAPIPPAVPYSDWIHRVGATLIDQVPIAIIVLIGIVSGSTAIYLVCLLVALVVMGYNRWYLGGQGQSWGKKVIGTRLISEETGQPIGTAMAFVRDICHVVDSVICYVGYLFPLWDEKRQTLADKIIKTVVVPV